MPYQDTPASDIELYETCARHTARATARRLQTIYLCDECTERLVREAFNARRPVYDGETRQGFCGLCNESRAVTQRQWFVCPMCWNVVLGFSKSLAASQAICDWWRSTIRERCPHLELVETEAMSLLPYARKTKTKLAAAGSLRILDFLASDTTGGISRPLFHIEQKTGPGSISEMREFQLDVNDFNDIAGATLNTRTPTYVVHAQVRNEYLFPTCRAVAVGLWWTDILTLAAHQKRVGVRRDEGTKKQAVYYAPAAFRPIDTFADHIATCGYDLVVGQLDQQRLPLIR